MKSIFLVIIFFSITNSVFSVPNSSLLTIDSEGKFCYDVHKNSIVSWETSPSILGTWCVDSVEVLIQPGDGFSIDNYTTNSGTANISFTKSGLYKITLNVVYKKDDELAPVSKIWSLNLIKISKVNILNHHDDLKHQDDKIYQAEVLNDRDENITSDVSLVWSVLVPNVSNLVDFDENVSTEDSYQKKWEIQGGEDSIMCGFTSATGFIKLNASCGEQSISDSFQFQVSKGDLIDNIEFYDLESDSTTPPVETRLGTDVVVKKSNVGGSVNVSVGGSFTISGSVTLSGSAKGSPKKLKGFIEILLGVSGSGSISSTVSSTITAMVPSSSTCDVRVSFRLIQSERNRQWSFKIKKTYSTGFIEKCKIGSVIGRNTDEVTYVHRDFENCN